VVAQGLKEAKKLRLPETRPADLVGQRRSSPWPVYLASDESAWNERRVTRDRRRISVNYF